MQSVNIISTVPEEPVIAEGRKTDNNTVIKQENHTTFEGNVGKIPQNLNTQKTNNSKRTTTELRPQTVFKRSQLDMDKALDTLWEIEYCIQNKDAQEQLGLKTDSGFWGTVKNLFCKFLGFFSNSVKENRTNALNQQIDDVLQKICNNEDFYKEVLLPIMNDKDIDEELKTACFNLFEDKEKLFSDLKNPNADIFRSLYENRSSKEMERKFTEDLNKLNANDAFNIFSYYKNEIKDGKLFGKDICKQWLSPLMNDKNSADETKLKFYNLFNDDPDIQDKLFTSLQEPPKEIREQFWERNKEKIQNGSILKELLGIKNLSANMKRDDFINCNGNPLKEMVFMALMQVPDNKELMGKDCIEIRCITEQKGVVKLLENKDDLQRYLSCYTNLVNTPGYMEKWLEMVTEVSKKDKELSKLQNKVSGIKDFLSGEKTFDAISKNSDLGTKDTFADMKPGRGDGKITFSFGQNRTLEIKTQTGNETAKDFFENIKKQVMDLKLNENEISRLADFLGTKEPQSYMVILKYELGCEEHSFKLNVSFEEQQTKITMPLNNNPVSLLSNHEVSSHMKSMKDFESFQNKLNGRYMSGTIEITAEGTSMINAKETTGFKDFKVETPKL